MYRVVFQGRVPGKSARPLVDETRDFPSLTEAVEWAASLLRATRDPTILNRLESLRVIDLSKTKASQLQEA
jgi:hypothetical protein